MTATSIPQAMGGTVALEGQGPGRVGVIGGGIAGLAAAHFLTDAGAEVSLFEASGQFGGLGTFFEHEGDFLDRFYHVLLPTDDDLLALLGTLGMLERVYWKETSLGFFYDRTLYELNSPLDLLRFKPATFVDRVRLGLTALYASYVAKPDPLDDITVEEWLTRLSGKRAFDRLWRPLLEAKFGDAYREIPALWYWASFNREKGTKKEVKGYIRGGYKGITDALVASLRSRGVALHLNTPVEHVHLTEDGSPVLQFAGEARPFDRLVVTLPYVQLRQIAAGGGLEPRLQRINDDLDYQGVLNVLVMLRRSLTKHYWIPVVNCDVPFQGIVETTRAVDLEDSGGRHLAYLLNYVHRSDPLFQRDPEELQRKYVDALLGLVPGLTAADVTDAAVFRAPFVEPLYTPGYGKRVPPEELVPGRVYLATTAQIYPNVTSWNSSTGLAKRVAERLVSRAGVPA
jgi:protoporphyrinogen oxidase